jgi:hypothetical protein
VVIGDVLLLKLSESFCNLWAIFVFPASQKTPIDRRCRIIQLIQAAKLALLPRLMLGANFLLQLKVISTPRPCKLVHSTTADKLGSY